MQSIHARSRRGMSAVLLGLLAVLLAGLGAAPAAAATPAHRVLTYVALGDSYAAGQATDCSHPATSYPRVLDRLHRIKLLRDAACAGATTSDLAGQLSALNRGVRVVTITAGANDLGLDAVAAACAPAPSSIACQQAIGTAASRLPALVGDLAAAYRAVAAAAPKATIVVTGYAPLLAAGPVHDATLALNAAIAQAVQLAAASGADIHYVDVDFGAHTLSGPGLPWFFVAGPDAFHPNAAGELAYAEAIEAALL
jgi:lysophospholipase L1-like esterase